MTDSMASLFNADSTFDMPETIVAAYGPDSTSPSGMTMIGAGLTEDAARAYVDQRNNVLEPFFGPSKAGATYKTLTIPAELRDLCVGRYEFGVKADRIGVWLDGQPAGPARLIPARYRGLHEIVPASLHWDWSREETREYIDAARVCVRAGTI